MGISILNRISQVNMIRNLAYFYICILSGALPLLFDRASLPRSRPIMHKETCPGLLINYMELTL
jgi:hypothetical protein